MVNAINKNITKEENVSVVLEEPSKPQTNPYEQAYRYQRFFNIDTYLRRAQSERIRVTDDSQNTLVSKSVTSYLDALTTCLNEKKEESLSKPSADFTALEAVNACVDDSLKQLKPIQRSAVFMYFDEH